MANDVPTGRGILVNLVRVLTYFSFGALANPAAPAWLVLLLGAWFIYMTIPGFEKLEKYFTSNEKNVDKPPKV